VKEGVNYKRLQQRVSWPRKFLKKEGVGREEVGGWKKGGGGKE